VPEELASSASPRGLGQEAVELVRDRVLPVQGPSPSRLCCPRLGRSSSRSAPSRWHRLPEVAEQRALGALLVDVVEIPGGCSRPGRASSPPTPDRCPDDGAGRDHARGAMPLVDLEVFRADDAGGTDHEVRVLVDVDALADREDHLGHVVVRPISGPGRPPRPRALTGRSWSGWHVVEPTEIS